MAKNNIKEKKKEWKSNSSTKVTTYSKKFENFKEGIEELRKLSDVFSDILYVDEYEDTPKACSEKMVEAFCASFPTCEENRFSSLNISSNRCILKTDKKLAFGWKFKYKREKDNSFIYDIEFVITVFGENPNLISDIEECGWVENK